MWNRLPSATKANPNFSQPRKSEHKSGGKVTPVSDYHAVAYRGLASKEFKIDVLAGSIEYAFLQCGDWLLRTRAGGNQVELHTDEKRG